MAQEVVVRFRINDNGELEGIANKAEKAAKSTDKLNKSRSRYNKTEKGVGQLTNNTTKAFSKQAQGISSGIVPAYATLAANVFAVTAAFGALERAIQNAKLEESLVFTGRAAGQNFKVLAQELREVADGALSTAEAMRAASFGISSGFNPEQLKQFTKVAKGASLALGRNLTDSIDRLVRGAAKLEPEILDELGIMVRLDDAAEAYAVTLGKNVNELSQFERRMAFANEIMVQGVTKYGALTNAMDASPFSKLAATFSDATQKALQNLADFFAPVAELLAGNMVILVGTIAALGTSVATAMVPALVDGGEAMADLAAETADAAKEQLRSLKSFEGAPKVFDELSEKVANGTATNAEYAKLKNSLSASERGHVSTLDRVTKSHGQGSKVLADKNRKLENVRNAQAQLTAAELAATQATHLNTRAAALNAAAQMDLKGTLTLLRTAWAQELAATTAATAGTGMYTTALAFLRGGISLTVFSLKTLAVFTMAALPMLGAVAIAGGMVYEMIAPLFREDPHVLVDAIEKMEETLKEIPASLVQFEETYARMTTRADQFNTALTLTAGLITSATGKLTEMRTIQKATVTEEKVQAQLQKFRLERRQAELKQATQGLNLTKEQVQNMGFLEKAARAFLDAQAAQDTAMGGQGTVTQNVSELIKNMEDLIQVETQLSDLNEKAIGDETERDAALRQLMVTQAALASQKSAVEALGGAESGEARILTESLTTLDTLISDLSTATADELPDALQATSDEMVKLNNNVNGVLNTFVSLDELVANVTARFNKLKPAQGVFAEDLNVMAPIFESIGDPRVTGEAEPTLEVLEKAKKAFEAYGIDVKNLPIDEAAEKFRVLYKETKAVNDLFNEESGRMALYAGEASMMAGVGQKASAEQANLEAVREQIALRERANEIEVDPIKKLEREAEIQRLITKERETQAKMLQAIAERQTMLGVGGATASLQAFTGAEQTQQAFAADGTTNAEKVGMLRTATQGFIDELKQLGPEGELMAAINESTLNMTELFAGAFDKIKDKSFELKDGLNVLAGVVSGLANIQAAKSKAAIAGVDREIAAEKKRDGKSAASLAKIKALEAKKDKMKRKAFEQDKKAKMASTVINTASGIVAALDDLPFPANIALAGMIGVMGAQQLAVISSMQYQGGGGGAPAGPSKVSVGAKSNTVDLARARSPAGELAYARGASGTGQGMTNYKPTPAFTGAKYRAAGGAAFMIGEQGPEMFVPEMPGTIVPADEVDDTRGISGPTNINFTIQAIDGQSVQEMLLGQRGNIIGMIRDAANASGEPFIENVNVLADSEEFNPSLMRN